MQNTQVAVVTGAGSGLGRAITCELIKQGMTVIMVGRHKDTLDETKHKLPEDKQECAVVVSANVCTDEGRQAIVQAVNALFSQNNIFTKVNYLIHNAGTLGPVEKAKNISSDQWRSVMEVNVNAPLFLTQALLPFMTQESSDTGKPSRVLHVGSGASQQAIEGWTAYCVSKSGFFMLYKCLDAELHKEGVRVGSVSPGIIDTPMQELIRSSSAEVLPSLSYFIEKKEKGELLAPEYSAKFIGWILTETENDAYGENEWDIYQDHHKKFWES